MANKFTQEKIDLIKKLYTREGLSIEKIAEQLKAGKSTISKYLRESNLISRKKSKYSDEILNEIKRLYTEENLGSTLIGRKLGIDERTVRRQLQNLGVEIRSSRKIYDYDLIKKLYLKDRVPIHMIAKQLKSSEGTISKILRQNGVEIYGHGMPKFDYHIFDSIDTEEKAYWLGFIFADGYIATINPNKPNYAFEISLKIEDYGHLEKFNSFTRFNGNNIKTSYSNVYLTSNLTEGIERQERCRWGISNKHLWETLNAYGCTPKKSLTLQFPDESIFKDKSLIRHFIRGYFDGDGCISFFDKEHTIPTFSIASKSKYIVETMLQFIPIDLNLHNSNKMWIINTCGSKAMAILHYIYDNCNIYLNRKYERFINFCRLYEKSDRLLETKIMEGCDANHEVNSEIKEAESPQRVGTEPEKSE